MSKDKKTKQWNYRGDTKMVSFRLPVETIAKLDAFAKALDVPKVQVVIEAIDEKGAV